MEMEDGSDVPLAIRRTYMYPRKLNPPFAFTLLVSAPILSAVLRHNESADEMASGREPGERLQASC